MRLTTLLLCSSLLAGSASASPLEPGCEASMERTGFWASVAAIFGFDSTEDGREVGITLPDGSSAIALYDGPTLDGGGIVFANVRIAANGKTWRVDSYGVGGLAKALCAPYADEYPHLYESAERRGVGERALSFDGLRAESVNADPVVRSIVCMKQPY